MTAPDDSRVQRLWAAWLGEEHELVAPTLLRYEVSNAFHRMRLANALSARATEDALRAAMLLPIALFADADLHLEALSVAGRFGLKASYDAHYLALADRLGVEFWTADRRLANTISSSLPWVRFVG